MPIGTWAWDVDVGNLRWSPGLFRLLGIDPTSERPSMDRYAGLVLPSDRLQFSETGRILTDRTNLERKFRIRRPDGIVRWLTCRREAIHDDNGALVSILGVVADVTTQEESRRTMQVTSSATEMLVGLLGGISTWRTRPDGSILEAPEWQRITGMTSEEVSGWGRLRAIHPDDVDGVRRAWRTAIAEGERYEAQYRIRRTDGHYLPVTSRGLALRGPDGEIDGWMGILMQTGLDGPAAGAVSAVDAEQFRAARALLDWTAQDLAAASGLSLSTIRRLEDGGSDAVAIQSVATAREALEAAGIRFLDDHTGAIGVALTRGDRRAARRIDVGAGA